MESASPRRKGGKKQSSREFFISFNRADASDADQLREWLEEAGYATFMQNPDFHAGSNFVLKMDEGLKTCRRLIAVLSPAYLAADFPQPEWAAFFAKDPRGEHGLVVGVRVKPCEIEGLLGTIRYIDLTKFFDDSKKQSELLRDISALPKPSKRTMKRNSQQIAETPTAKKDSEVPVSIKVSGDVEHLAARDMTVNHFHEPQPKPKVVIERRESWITDAQSVQIKEQVTELAEMRFETSNGRLKRGDAFRNTYGDFYRTFEIPRYEALPTERFDEALEWFRCEKGKLTRKLRRLDKPAWRNARIGSIKKAMTILGRTNDDYYPEIAARLKMPSFHSLKDLTDKNLQRVYQIAMRDAGQVEM